MRIVKCRVGQRETFEQIPGFVYCGRNFGGFAKSPLHNPFRGADCIQRYWKWLHHELVTGNALLVEAMSRLTSESVLGCWCVDKAVAGEGTEDCHCDVIAKAWKWLNSVASNK